MIIRYEFVGLAVCPYGPPYSPDPVILSAARHFEAKPTVILSEATACILGAFPSKNLASFAPFKPIILSAACHSEAKPTVILSKATACVLGAFPRKNLAEEFH